MIIAGSGLLLQLKKHWSWIQPTELRGTGGAPAVDLDRILASVRAVPETLPQPASAPPARGDGLNSVLESMRPLRFLLPGHLVEVTSRTIHGRALLRPDRKTSDLILGVLGRAQARYRMRIVAFVFLSNHFHLLVLPDSPQQLASFMGYLASNVAREVGRVRRWRDKFWARRYRAITVSNEDLAQVARMRYVLAHGAKEGLVATPREWPGPQCVGALLEDASLQGTWFDRTAEYRTRRKGLDCSSREFASPETVTLTPLPCWADWTPSRRQEAVAALVATIELDAEIARGGRPAMGREALLRQHPDDPPNRIKRSRAPAFHAASAAAFRSLKEAYRIFLSAFWHAAELLRAGHRAAQFPEGSFPPALPYVPVASG